uniref:Uncharacterized protein n=1 Tax=Peronospora matthiolae TaxID=2874970 RepID=A0AAV1VIU7_9STRA
MFWGDAYYTRRSHILNRALREQTQRERHSLEVLTGKTPDLRGIVVFGSQCSVYRRPARELQQLPQRLGRAIIYPS